MQWTTEKPTEPGYYWFRSIGSEEYTIYWVVLEPLHLDRRKNSPMVLAVYEFGEYERDLVKHINGEWCKIPEPKDIVLE